MSSTKGPFCRSCGHQASPEANLWRLRCTCRNPSDDNFVAFNDAELGPERGSFLTNYTDEQTALPAKKAARPRMARRSHCQWLGAEI